MRAPLGLPTGSVRAVLAGMLLATVCGLSAFGLTVPDKLWTLTEMALAVYFVARGTSGKGA